MYTIFQNFNNVVMRFRTLDPRPLVAGYFGKRRLFFSEYGYRPHVSGVFRAPKRGGFQIRSPGWRVLKTEIHRIRVDGRKRRFSNTMTSCLAFKARSSTHTIRKRYVWMQIFFKYGEKNLRFRKYPATCGRGLSAGA